MIPYQVKSPGDDVSDHKFKVGQTVHYTSGPYPSSWRGGVFKIMQLLPPQGGDYQYRIKNADEPYDRVVKEVSSTGQYDRAWHSIKLAGRIVYTQTQGVGGRRAPTVYRRFATAT